MPSHKHKKKKKSHKRSKRHSSLSSEDTLSPWRVPLTDTDSDESSNQEQLTALVRRTYVNYLKQALTLNLNDWAKNLNEPQSETIEEIVDKWSSVLEQKAMRTCMISELYRTSMVSLIRQIKASTSEKKLYIENLPRIKSKIPLNKAAQTESPELGQEVETQTDFQMTSLLELPMPKSSPMNKPYDPAINFPDSDSNDGGVSSSLGSKQPQSGSATCGVQDICNISSTSDLVGTAELSIREDRVKAVDVAIGSDRRSSVTLKSEIMSYLSDKECLEMEHEIRNNINSHDTVSLNDDQSSLGSKKLVTIKKRQASVDASPNPKINLDERLSALGLFVDNGDDSLTQPIGKSKRSNWYAEEIAQSCNLTRILMRMTTRQREKVLKKIKDLFGDENNSLTELSEENISVCRKRIASVVVMELTPVYQAKKIASRYLFKFLAKKITRSIMEKSLAPDTKSIRWRVQKYFEDGKVIMSETDCV